MIFVNEENVLEDQALIALFLMFWFPFHEFFLYCFLWFLCSFFFLLLPFLDVLLSSSLDSLVLFTLLKDMRHHGHSFHSHSIMRAGKMLAWKATKKRIMMYLMTTVTLVCWIKKEKSNTDFRNCVRGRHAILSFGKQGLMRANKESCFQRKRRIKGMPDSWLFDWDLMMKKFWGGERMRRDLDHETEQHFLWFCLSFPHFVSKRRLLSGNREEPQISTTSTHKETISTATDNDQIQC